MHTTGGPGGSSGVDGGGLSSRMEPVGQGALSWDATALSATPLDIAMVVTIGGRTAGPPGGPGRVPMCGCKHEVGMLITPADFVA